MARGNDTFFGNIVRASIEVVTSRVTPTNTDESIAFGDTVIINNDGITTSVSGDTSSELNISTANATGTVGDININAGNNQSAGTGGDITLTSGVGTGASSGNVSISTGVSNTESGNINISTGLSADTGNIGIFTGSAGTFGPSGNINLFTGSGTIPGAINLNAGDYADTNGNGANITLRAGNGNGTGADGEIILNNLVTGGVVLPNIAGASLPTTASTGAIAFNTTTSKVAYFDGATWTDLP